jgi:hypothetical protein
MERRPSLNWIEQRICNSSLTNCADFRSVANRQFSEGIRTPTRSPHEDPCQSAGYRHARSDCHCGHKAAGPIYCESRQSRCDHTCQVREAILQAGPSAGCFWTSECLGECENAPLKAIMKTYLLLTLLRSIRPRTRKTKILTGRADCIRPNPLFL